ncbi:MAG: CRISPR-associated protein Cas4 [Candidatus Freyarchaeota archaeon]|nr:CRISPR-associated protein Cas4 [Candidatus Jordarchaeia archaeon]
MSVFFTAEDVRQYAYCKRKVYFRYVLRARVKPTVKMERGREEHLKLESRRKRSGGAYFSMYLFSERLGLAGVVDYLKYEGGEVIPVEVKFGRWERVYSGHYLQLAAHALLLEEHFGLDVVRGVIEYPDGEVVREVKITEKVKLKVIEVLSRIRRIVLEEEVPPPSLNASKCEGCEAYRVCRGC